MLVQLGLPTRLKLHVMNWMAHKVGSCTRSGSKLLRWRNVCACSIRFVGKTEATCDELDGIHKGLRMWKHFEGTKNWPRCYCSCFVRALV